MELFEVQCVRICPKLESSVRHEGTINAELLTFFVRPRGLTKASSEPTNLSSHSEAGVEMARK